MAAWYTPRSSQRHTYRGIAGVGRGRHRNLVTEGDSGTTTNPYTAKEEAVDAEARLSALNAKHAELEHAIEEEAHRPLPDTLHLSELKRQKLKVKEELSQLEAH